MQISKSFFFKKQFLAKISIICVKFGALNLSAGSKYFIGDNQMRPTCPKRPKTGKFDATKLSHNEKFWFTRPVVMALTYGYETNNERLRTNFHLCLGRFNCDQISVLRSGTFKFRLCTICSFDSPRPGVIFSSSLLKFPPSKLMVFI